MLNYFVLLKHMQGTTPLKNVYKFFGWFRLPQSRDDEEEHTGESLYGSKGRKRTGGEVVLVELLSSTRRTGKCAVAIFWHLTIHSWASLPYHRPFTSWIYWTSGDPFVDCTKYYCFKSEIKLGNLVLSLLKNITFWFIRCTSRLNIGSLEHPLGSQNGWTATC